MAIQSNFPAIRPSLLLDFANSKRLDPRITFTRASTARYYDGSTVAKAEENLVLQSQTFDTASWTANRLTKAADVTTAPDGTSTADSITETATTGSHNIHPNGATTVVTSAAYTFSCFVKPNGRDYVQLTFGSYNTQSRYAFAVFDVAGGSVTESGSTGSATYTSSSITSVGGGWYRVSITASLNTGTDGYPSIGCSDSGTPSKSFFGDPTYAGDITKGLYLWGAQLEQRSAVTAYTATTTAPITNYVPVLQTAQNGVPRFDHNPTTGESLGLLIEEQRTNLFNYSEQFDNAYWDKASNVTVEANQVIAPDGTLTADLLREAATTATHRLAANTNSAISGTSVSTTYAISCYFKAGGGVSIPRLSLADPSGSHQCNAFFNLSAQTVATTVLGSGVVNSTSIVSVGNGWFRCVMVATATGGTGGVFAYVGLGQGTSISYAGATTNYVYLWGGQFETGAFATSYIPAVAASATRQADAASMTGTNFSSWFRDDEGTMYFEGQRNATTNVQSAGAWGLVRSATSTGTTNCYTTFEMAHSNTSRPRVLAFDGAGTATGDLYSTAAYTTAIRTAVALKNSDAALAVNGTLTTSSTYRLVQQAVRLFIGSNGVAADRELNGTIRKLAFYASRLTNAQLQAITG